MDNGTLNVLVGAQLINLTEKGFSVIKNGKEYEFTFEKDHGDCCGYNRIKTQLFVDSNERPVITDIKITDEINDDYNCEKCQVTLFGLDKTIAEINTISSSGSGWQYGAYVKVNCAMLGVDRVLSRW